MVREKKKSSQQLLVEVVTLTQVHGFSHLDQEFLVHLFMSLWSIYSIHIHMDNHQCVMFLSLPAASTLSNI